MKHFILYLTILISILSFAKNECSSKCANCDPKTGYCIECGEAYYFDVYEKAGGELHTACKATSLSNCKTALSTSVCEECDYGFKVSSSQTCEACTGTRCRTCDDSVAICSTCDQGYGFSSSSVTVCDTTCTASNCFQCKTGDASKCSYCNTGYSLGSDELCTVSQISGCTTYDSNSAARCTACEDGWFLRLGRCYRCDVGCAKCLNNSTCTSCITVAGYYMRSDKKCYPDRIAG